MNRNPYFVSIKKNYLQVVSDKMNSADILKFLRNFSGYTLYLKFLIWKKNLRVRWLNTFFLFLLTTKFLLKFLFYFWTVLLWRAFNYFITPTKYHKKSAIEIHFLRYVKEDPSY